MTMVRPSIFARDSTVPTSSIPAAILIHGRGATPESMLPLADAFGRDDIRYLAPAYVVTEKLDLAHTASGLTVPENINPPFHGLSIRKPPRMWEG